VTYQLKEEKIYTAFREVFEPEHKECFVFIVGNYFLYIAGVFLYFTLYCLLYSVDDWSTTVTWCDITSVVINVGWAIFGSTSCWTEELEAKVLKKP
jgi:hypothetical protein